MSSRSTSAHSYPSEISFGSIKFSHLSQIEVTDRIPGYRTSAAFFASLRANLRLSESSPTPLPSPVPAPLGASSKTKTNASASGRSGLALNGLAPPSPLILPHTSSALQNAKPLPSPLHQLSLPAAAINKSLPRPRSGSQSASSVTNRPVILSTPEEKEESAPLFFWTTSVQDTGSALSLISASVAEQKQFAFRSLLLHPLNVFVFVLLLFIVQKSMFCVARYTSMKNKTAGLARPDSTEDAASWLEVTLVWAGITLTYLAVAQIVTQPYSKLSRRINVQGADGPSSGDANDREKEGGGTDPWFKSCRDEVLVAVVSESSPASDDTNFASESEKATGQCTQEREIIVGALIMSFVPGAAGGKLNKRRRSSGGRGYVRAWAVSPSWRGQGIGGSMLDEAARVVLKERGGDCVCFAESHAHAERVLPDFYNGHFDRRDRRAKWALLRAVETRPWTLNRRR